MNSRVYIDDLDVVKMFIDEWMECLEGLEKEILKLEIHSEDGELLNNIFRRVHSIKGGSSFVGLSCITRLSHEVEFTLDSIRKGTISVNTELIDSLLLSIDFLNGYITRLFNKLKDHDYKEENGNLFIDFPDEQSEASVLESLKLTRENCEDLKFQNSIIEEEAQEEVGLDVLQSEEFRKGLSKGMKEQFLLETSEHIDQIENHLLIELDKNSQDKELVRDLFRLIHSIKGGIGIFLAALLPQSPLHVGLKKFSEIIHNFESLMACIRDRSYPFEKKLIDLSYEVMDYSKLMMGSVASEEPEQMVDRGILEKIMTLISQVQAYESTGVRTHEAAYQEAGKADESKLKNNISQSIRVNQEKIDTMMNMISELIIAKNAFMHLSNKLCTEYNLPGMSKEVKQVGASVNRISDELQNAIMSIRMVEVKTVFQKMPRVVRDISQSTGKKMELLMEGESTEIDKTIIEQISDPLVHLIRNSADHGIESPEDRIGKGKAETGRIVLRAYNKNKYVYIEIEDDGKGIDAGRVKEKAIEKGFITEADAQKMSRTQLVNLIFLPGFSTAKQITEVSGRGVGMDIVKSNITKLNGTVAIESELDKGTKMIIRLPLTLAVSRGLIVESSGDSYIFPLEYISETVKISKESIHELNGNYFVCLRGDVIGADWLCRIFLTGERDHEASDYNAVILTNGAEKHAIIVDRLVSEQEFVVKTLEGQLSSIPGISGSTLLGNGKVVLIVNPNDILNQTGTKKEAHNEKSI